MRGRHYISIQNFKAFGIWISLLNTQHDQTPGSTPAPLTSQARALIPHPILDPIPRFTLTPLPSQLGLRYHLLGSSGEHREKQQANTTGPQERETPHFHPEP
jgi:hypothetical protein